MYMCCHPARPAHSGAAVALLEEPLIEGLASGESKAVDWAFWADVRAEAQRLVAQRGTTGRKK